MKLKHIFSLLLLPALILTSYASESLNPLEKFDQFVAQRRNIKQAEKHVSEGEYKKAAKSFRKAAKEQVTPEKTAEYYLREAESFLMAKKCSKAKEAYTALLEKHLFHIPLDRVLEQMRELADHFENGRGTFLGIDDPGAAIQIYETIIKYQPSVEESIEDRLVLAGKLAAYGITAEACLVGPSRLKAPLTKTCMAVSNSPPGNTAYFPKQRCASRPASPVAPPGQCLTMQFTL
jgi:tetratricopeptide (TPR) repeat protein